MEKKLKSWKNQVKKNLRKSLIPKENQKQKRNLKNQRKKHM